MKKVVVFILFIVTGFSSVNASDFQREKRMADEIVDAILDGDAVFLSADLQGIGQKTQNNNEFLTIYTETSIEPARGTTIILHGRGFHPDWQDTVGPLRVGLIESGWNTLSVQMPVLHKEAKYYDYEPLFPQSIPRIEAAIRYAREQLEAQNGKDQSNESLGSENQSNKQVRKNRVVLIAHSCGAHMAMAFVDSNSVESVDAYIGLGMGATDYGQLMKQPFPLEKIKVPVLDVYAENDYPAVIKMAPERLRMITAAGNKKSAQQVVPGSDHYYTDEGDALTELVANWLQTLQ